MYMYLHALQNFKVTTCLLGIPLYSCRKVPNDIRYFYYAWHSICTGYVLYGALNYASKNMMGAFTLGSI